MLLHQFVYLVLSIAINEALLTPRTTRLGRTRMIPWTVVVPARIASHTIRRSVPLLVLNNTNNNKKKNDPEEWSDFEDMGYSVGGEDPLPKYQLSSIQSSKPINENNASSDDKIDMNEQLRIETQKRQQQTSWDYTAIQTRQFSLGKDLILTNYVGNMGFDEVTDWQYYYPEEDEDGRPRSAKGDRKVVLPNPLDSTKPRRTRVSSGSVVRIFRGEFVGTLGGAIGAAGLDRRILVKEFSGNMALALAKAELKSIGRLQSTLLLVQNNKIKDNAKFDDQWIQAARRRSVSDRDDNANLIVLQKILANDASFLGAFGEVNLAEVDFEPNEFYQALSVAPPKADAVWLVYEYAGLSTIQAYCMPAETRRARLPPQKGFFGNPIPPPALPPFRERAKFVVQGIIKQALAAVVALHEEGIVHRSIGRTTFVLTTPTMDKRNVISIFNTRISTLRVKISDLGFSGRLTEAANEEEFCVRAQSFGLTFRKGNNNFETVNFAIAEDVFAFGFVVIGLLLTSLAEISDPNQTLPATDEDTLQRLIGEIFDKDFEEFREYVDAEDAWTSLVAFLDEKDRAGWKFLEALLLCRENVSKLNKDGVEMISYLRNLLSSPFLITS